MVPDICEATPLLLQNDTDSMIYTVFFVAGIQRILWIRDSGMTVSLSQVRTFWNKKTPGKITQNNTSALQNASRTMDVPHETFYVSSFSWKASHETTALSQQNSRTLVFHVSIWGVTFCFTIKWQTWASPTTWRTKVQSCNITSLNWPFYGWHRSIEFVKVPK